MSTDTPHLARALLTGHLPMSMWADHLDEIGHPAADHARRLHDPHHYMAPGDFGIHLQRGIHWSHALPGTLFDGGRGLLALPSRVAGHQFVVSYGRSADTPRLARLDSTSGTIHPAEPADLVDSVMSDPQPWAFETLHTAARMIHGFSMGSALSRLGVQHLSTPAHAYDRVAEVIPYHLEASRQAGLAGITRTGSDYTYTQPRGAGEDRAIRWRWSNGSFQARSTRPGSRWVDMEHERVTRYTKSDGAMFPHRAVAVYAALVALRKFAETGVADWPPRQRPRRRG